MRCPIVLCLCLPFVGCGASQGPIVREPLPAAACTRGTSAVTGRVGADDKGTWRESPEGAGRSAKAFAPPGAAELQAASPLASLPEAARKPEPSPVALSHPLPLEVELPERQSMHALKALAGTIPVEHSKRGATIRLAMDDLFPPGAMELNPSEESRLGEIATALAAQSGRPIVIDAYTDSLGDRSENVRLSFLHAAALMDYFVSKGIPQDQMRAEGSGPDHPIADNDTPAGRAENRRIEIVVGAPVAPTPR